MPEEVFRPFFEANADNNIDLSGQKFDCSDCKSAWLKIAKQFHSRLINIKCEDGKISLIQVTSKGANWEYQLLRLK